MLAHVLCDIIIDFRSTDPENDLKIARSMLTEYEKLFRLQEGSFQLGEARPISMGWSVAKLFISLELAQRLYENNSFEIERANERMKTYKFLLWLNTAFGSKGCKAQLKYAEDMKNTSGGHKYSSEVVTVFSDEFAWSR
jgi:hypothetical protein